MKTTPLHDAHLKLKAKMGEFAGYDMPLYYADGVLAEHNWTRAHASLFDVSHMGQLILSGAGAQDFLEKLTPSSYGSAPAGRAKYSVLTNEQGGIIDDLIVTKMAADKFFVVVNAGCKDKDFAWLREHLPAGVQMDILEDRALLALQGPESEQVLRDIQRIDTDGMPYMWLLESQLTDGTPVFISRLGYTGEDGFEISVPASMAEGLWTQFLTHGAVKPAGLAARDSLRLEMGYPLYGHDIDDTTSPAEAGIGWIVGKDNHDFIGAQTVRAHMETPPRQRVGLKLLAKGIAREGAEILINGTPAGKVTSGSHAPTLNYAVAMGYVPAAHAAPGTKVELNVRGRLLAAEIVPLPFMKPRTRSMKPAV